MFLCHNLLSEQDLSLINKTLRKSHWGYEYTSTDLNKPIWNFDKEHAEPLARIVASKIEGYTLTDWNINGQTKLMDGAVHTDSYPECTHVFVFFPQEWKYSWGGRLHLFPKDNDPIVITPMQNMGILFDSSIPHYAEGVNQDFKWLRTTIGLKLFKNL